MAYISLVGILILFGLGIIVVSIGINLFLYLIDTSPDKELIPFVIKRTIKTVLYVVFFIALLLFYFFIVNIIKDTLTIFIMFSFGIIVVLIGINFILYQVDSYDKGLLSFLVEGVVESLFYIVVFEISFIYIFSFLVGENTIITHITTIVSAEDVNIGTELFVSLNIIVILIGINLVLYMFDTSPDKELMPFLAAGVMKGIIKIIGLLIWLSMLIAYLMLQGLSSGGGKKYCPHCGYYVNYSSPCGRCGRTI